VQPGDELRVKILEIDSDRRRLSLSAKRVEGQVLPVRRIEPEPGAGEDGPADADAEAPSDVEAEAAPEALAAPGVEEAAPVEVEADRAPESAPQADAAPADTDPGDDGAADAPQAAVEVGPVDEQQSAAE
ncbi:MAG: S1 RNA-binding domain-containing protein, partial [Solirubrobacteraceae bacterium]